MDKVKVKKVVDIVVNVLLWIFLIFAAVLTIFAIAATTNADKIPQIGGKCYLAVISDSMKPAFKTGDLLICEDLDEEELTQLQVGDVVTFSDEIKGGQQLNTHRIVEVVKDDNGNVIRYKTQGDNHEMSSVAEDTAINDIICRWTGKKVPVVGHIINLLNDKWGFFGAIVLPLALLLGYQVFVFVRSVLKVKNAGKRQITAADEELIKQRAVEEYLRSQAAAQNGGAPAEPAQASTTEQKPEGGAVNAEVPNDDKK